MTIIEVIYSKRVAGEHYNDVDVEFFQSHDQVQQWREQYHEYEILEIIENDLDEEGRLIWDTELASFIVNDEIVTFPVDIKAISCLTG